MRRLLKTLMQLECPESAAMPCLLALLIVVIHFVVAALGQGGALER